MYRLADTPPEPAPAAPKDFAEVPTEHLEAELCELSAHLAAGMARWIALVDEYDRREGWGSWWGVVSTAHWISWRCSSSTRMAREHVRVARALRDLPATRESFARGELSYSKVRSLTCVATAEAEEFLLHQARYATAQLDHMLGAYRQTERLNPECHGDPGLTWHWNRDGSLKVEARFAPDDGRALLDALETARSHIREESSASGDENGPAGPRADAGPAGPLLGDAATNADALSVICESFLAHGRRQSAGPQGPHLVVHVDAERLKEPRTGAQSSSTARAFAPRPPAASAATRHSRSSSSAANACSIWAERLARYPRP